MDFSTLTGLKESLFNSTNRRQAFINVINKLRAILPNLKDDYINGFYNLLPESALTIPLSSSRFTFLNNKEDAQPLLEISSDGDLLLTDLFMKALKYL